MASSIAVLSNAETSLPTEALHGSPKGSDLYSSSSGSPRVVPSASLGIEDTADASSTREELVSIQDDDIVVIAS